MRAIKFRVWDKTKKKFRSYGKLGLQRLFEKFSLAGCSFEREGGVSGGDNPDFSDLVIQQFTGLTKDNQEIYEGDILSFLGYFRSNNNRKIGVVEWRDYDASFMVNEWHDGKGCWDYHTFCEIQDVGEFNVIGNIFENPLLEK